ncbi:MAG: zf-HC2 domain-containing protein [Candidatus Poribacteria bacterium]|nr:zf-HC2 domain-containing protein [Candidatus Poribacteria bacterium]
MNQFSRPQDSACLEVQDSLEAYLADELDAETHARIAAHVTSCPKCQDEVHFTQTISEALHELPRLEPPPEVFDAVAAYVRAHPDKGERWWHRLFQLSTFWDNLTFSLVRAGVLVCLAGIVVLLTVSDNLDSAFIRASALVCFIGVVLFGTHQYQRYLKVKQASRDLYYALGKLSYAVARTGTVVSEKLPDVQINEASGRLFVQIERAFHYASKQTKHISSVIYRSLENFNRFPENVRGTEHQHRPS